MGNAWITLWLSYFYYGCITWEMPGSHYGYHTFTMDALKEMPGSHYGYHTFTMDALHGNYKIARVKQAL